MLIGCKETDVMWVLHTLENSPFKFYLTGSRFFGVERKNSDWDFFTEESEAVEKFLLKEGFKLLSETRYRDTMTAKVYRYTNLIDVQLVTNAEKKLAIQKSFLLAGTFHPNKNEWNMAAHRYDSVYKDDTVILSAGAFRVHQI